MSIKYIEEHDICFWKKSFSGSGYNIDFPKFAWEDFGLIPLSRPYISTPKANYTLVQIPNSSSRLNITDYMPGGMTYESRTGEWQFAIDHTKELWKNWYTGYYEVEDYFHGSRMLVSLNDDSEKIYEGRITVSAYDPGENYSKVALSYDLDAMPIDMTSAQYRSMIFRIRFLNYNAKVNEYGYFEYNSYPTHWWSENSYVPENAVFTGWRPHSITPAVANVDYSPKYYIPVIATEESGSSHTEAPSYSALSSHPIQYVIEEPDEKVESTHEVPDNVKFLFNNVNYAIDVLGNGGTIIKRLWYTPDNFGIETTE